MPCGVAKVVLVAAAQFARDTRKVRHGAIVTNWLEEEQEVHAREQSEITRTTDIVMAE